MGPPTVCLGHESHKLVQKPVFKRLSLNAETISEPGTIIALFGSALQSTQIKGISKVAQCRRPQSFNASSRIPGPEPATFPPFLQLPVLLLQFRPVEFPPDVKLGALPEQLGVGVQHCLQLAHLCQVHQLPGLFACSAEQSESAIQGWSLHPG